MIYRKAGGVVLSVTTAPKCQRCGQEMDFISNSFVCLPCELPSLLKELEGRKACSLKPLP